MSRIGLLDCNNFFVSCERLFRPDLAHRPVVVLSSNDGCIVARSQEVKDIGIPMGVPYFKVKDNLKDIDTAVFSSHFTLYRDLSKRVFAVLREHVSSVHEYSIDEAFFTVSDDTDAAAWAEKIKKDIWQRIGIPVSIGLAPTKTLAKRASKLAKRHESGVYELTECDWRATAAEVGLGELWGVGSGRVAQFRAHGLVTCAEFMATPLERIERLFGVDGARLWHELQGVSAVTVRNRLALQKSLMSTRSFRTAATDCAVVEDAVAYHVRRVAEDLRAMRAVAGTLRVLIRPSRHGSFAFRGGSSECQFAVPTNSTETLLEAAIASVQQLYMAGVPYKKAGVIVSDIQLASAQTQSLFEATIGNRSTSELDSIIDTLNRRFGHDVVALGRRNRTDAWQSDRSHLSPVSTTNWANLPIISAK